jgi:hypothetical protein
MVDILEQSKELRKIWGGFQGARVLLTANNYRVFDYLKKQKAAAGLAKDIGADKRATEILLDALTGFGLLKKQKGQYKNSSLASQFLVSGSPYYQGDIIRHADTLWQNWSGLDNIVIQEFFIDKDRTHPVQAALFSINMLANTSGGRCYSPEEVKRWYLKTGFRKIQKQLLADSVLISAEK